MLIKQDISTKNQEILLKEHEITKKNQEILLKNEEISQKYQEILQKEAILNKKNEVIGLKDKEIIEKTHEILSKANEINKKTKEIDDKNYKINELTQEILRKEEIIKDLTARYEASTTSKSQDIESLRKELVEKSKFLDNLNGTLMKKDEIIKEFIKKLEKLGFERNNDLAILKEELLNKANLLENLKKTLLDKEILLERLNQKIEDLDSLKEKELCVLKEEIKEKHRIIEDIRGNLRNFEILKQELEGKINEKNKEIYDLKGILEGHAKYVKEKNGFIEDLRRVVLEKEGVIEGLRDNGKENERKFNSQLEENKEEIIHLETILIEKNKDIERLKQLNQENIKDISLGKEKNLDLEENLTKINEELLKNREIIKLKNEEISQKNEDISEKSRDIFEKKKEIENLKQGLLKKESAIKSINEKCKVLESEIEVKEEEIHEKIQDLSIKTKEIEQLKANLILKNEEFFTKNQELSEKLNFKDQEILEKTIGLTEKMSENENIRRKLLEKEGFLRDLHEKLKEAEFRYFSKDQAFLLLNEQMKLILETLSNTDCEKDAKDKALRSLKEAYNNLNLLLEERGDQSEVVKVLQAQIKQISEAHQEYMALYENLKSTKRQRNKALEYLHFLLPFGIEKNNRKVLERKRTSGAFFEENTFKIKEIKHLKRSFSEDSKEKKGKNQRNFLNLLENYKQVRKEIERNQRRNEEALEIIGSDDATQLEQLEALAQLKNENSEKTINDNLALNENLIKNFIEKFENLDTSQLEQLELLRTLQISHKTLKKQNKRLKSKITDFQSNFSNLSNNLEKTLLALSSKELSSQSRDALLLSLQKELLKMRSLALELSSSKENLSSVLKQLENTQAMEELSEKEKAVLQEQLRRYLQVIEDIESQYEMTKKDLEISHIRLQESLNLLKERSLSEEEREKALRRLQACDDELCVARRRLNDMAVQKKKTMRGLEDLQAELENVRNKEKNYQELLSEKGVECDDLKRICEDLMKEKERFDRELEIIKGIDVNAKKDSIKAFGYLEDMIKDLLKNQEGFFEKFMMEMGYLKRNNKEEIELQEKLKEFRKKLLINEASLSVCQKELERLMEELDNKDVAYEDVVKKLKARLTIFTKGFIDLQIENKLIKNVIIETNSYLERFKEAVVRDFEEFVKKKHELFSSETQNFQENMLKILGELTQVLESIEENYENIRNQTNFEENQKNINENMKTIENFNVHIDNNQRIRPKDLIENFRTESTAITHIKNNNFRTMTSESEPFNPPLSTNANVIEDSIGEMMENEWTTEASNQLNIIKKAYENLTEKFKIEEENNRKLSKELIRFKGLYKEIYKKIKFFSKKIKELQNLKEKPVFKTNSIKNSNFFRNSQEIEELTSWRNELKSHLLEIVENVDYLEKNLENSLKFGSITKKSPHFTEIDSNQSRKFNLNLENIEKRSEIEEIVNFESEYSSKNPLESPRELIETLRCDIESPMIALSTPHYISKREEIVKIHKRNKTFGHLLKNETKTMNLKIGGTQRTQISLDFGESLERINRTMEDDTGFLKKENLRLSFELNHLEQNYKENSVWAKGLNETLTKLKENILKHENFQSSLITIITSPKDPKFFDIFTTFTSDQQNIILQIKRKIDIHMEKSENLKQNEKTPAYKNFIKKKSEFEGFLIETPILDKNPLYFTPKTPKKIYFIEQGVQKNDENEEKSNKINKELHKMLKLKEKELLEASKAFELEKQSFERKTKEIELKASNFYQKILLKQQTNQKEPIKHQNAVNTNNIHKEMVKSLQERLQFKENEVIRWKDRYGNLERKYHEIFQAYEDKSLSSQKISLDPQGNNNAGFSQNREEIEELKQKMELQEQVMRVNKLKAIEERASMQKIIKGLKDEMIEKKTIGILKEMGKEFDNYQNLKNL